MRPVTALVLHLSVFIGSLIFLAEKSNFYSICTKIVQNNLLHFLHTTLVTHALFVSVLYISQLSMGKLSISEQASLQENVYGAFGDLVLIISFFPSNFDMLSALALSFLFAVKSLVWVFEIKSQRYHSKNMFLGGVVLSLFCSACALFHLRKGLVVYSLTTFIVMEYVMVVISLLKTLLVILLGINEVENSRSFFMLVIDIGYLSTRCLVYAIFVLFIAVNYRFPFNIMRSLLSTAMKLKKKLFLFKDYLRLCRELDKIEEVDIDGNCVICTDALVRGKVLKCSHVFHSQCLKMWCEQEMTCPMCRAPLTFKKEVQIVEGNEVLTGIPVDIVS